MVSRALHDAWWRLATQDRPASLSDALAAGLLQAGSLAYRAAVGFRNGAYDRGWAKTVELPCAVVSVGNLTVGGAGKTTCVELIVGRLTAAGRRVAVLSRGYGGRPGPYWLRWDRGRLTLNGGELADPGTVADEPQLLARRLPGVPVIVGPSREATGQLACREFGADTVVLDDGFQHRRVRRDCDIVLIHVRTPLAGFRWFPRGPMRESLTAVRRAHVAIITKADEALESVAALSERLRAINPELEVLSAAHEPVALVDPLSGLTQDPKPLAGHGVGLVSSIGDPEGFEATIRRLHASVVWHLAFPDHHRYQPADWDAIRRQVERRRPDALVTTAKDWVRLAPLLGRAEEPQVPLRVLQVRMAILEGSDRLDDRLARVSPR